MKSKVTPGQSTRNTGQAPTVHATAKMQLVMCVLFLMMSAIWFSEYTGRESLSPSLLYAGDFLIKAGFVLLPVVLARAMYLFWSASRSKCGLG